LGKIEKKESGKKVDENKSKGKMKANSGKKRGAKNQSAINFLGIFGISLDVH